jgi:hypothetical protein
MAGPEPSSGEEAIGVHARPLAVLANEFASVEVALDQRGHSPRLLVRDVETDDQILISPIELASLCLATTDDRVDWLHVGKYRSERER